ncbi:MAG: hypothetical protein HQK75_14975 [Candidatus Magnetomorum sp.]|nr:hypothetical protein [Candidatus Magnetomorum sp.]
MPILPLTYIFSLPPAVQMGYFSLSLLIGLLGINRIMGFWGNMFCSVIFSPIVGLLVLLVSSKKKSKA